MMVLYGRLRQRASEEEDEYRTQPTGGDEEHE